jgi:hypothetical protein
LKVYVKTETRHGKETEEKKKKEKLNEQQSIERTS